MSDVTLLGIDLAKNVFQLHGVNSEGKVVFKKQIRSRSAFMNFVAKLPRCRIGMEACGSAHYWARKFVSHGHDVVLLHAKYVKAFVDRNKNDAADAKACYRALCQPDMKHVPIKSAEQQSLLMLEKNRSRLMHNKTQLSNQIKAFLYEFGLAVPRGESTLRKIIPEILEDYENNLPMLARTTLAMQLDEYKHLCQQIKQQTARIEEYVKSNEDCMRLMTIPGVGPINAFMLTASLKGYEFKAGRQAAAWIGLTPKECSSGGTKRMLGISKQGNKKLRCLLVHAARSVVRVAKNKDDKLSRWIRRIEEEKGFNKAVVALANKIARNAWSILQNKTVYDSNFADYYEYKHAA